jgi:predicted DNA-binding transcriptional regulator YafY
VEVDVPASQNDAFVAWVLSFGPDIRVVGPKRLRDAVVSQLASLAGHG